MPGIENPQTHIKNLQLLGYSVVPGFLSIDQVEVQKALLQMQVERLKGAQYPGYSEHRPYDEQVFNLQAKDSRFLGPLGDSGLERVLMAMLNDEYYRSIPQDQPNYILGEYIARASGGSSLRLHIDSWMPVPGPHTWMMQIAIALDDRPREAGCTVVVPGSHLSGQFTDRDFSEVTPLPMRAGDLALWDSRLWHGALPAQPEAKSWALIATVQRWWVKPRFDIPRGLPHGIFAQLSDKQKALLGYCAIPPANEFEGTDTRGGYATAREFGKASS